MKSNLISASILAIAALTSVSSFAESQMPSDKVSTVSTKTRAEVRAELVQAQHQGYVSTHRMTDQVQMPVGSNLTRSDVRAQVAALGPRASGAELDRNYPAVTY